MVLRKKVAIFDWEWGRNSAPRDGQKRPCYNAMFDAPRNEQCYKQTVL